ncbi:MAG TPA: two-component regulator propeller domain-containing protein [Blastocatellia bacterium]|nr:two-component regulator propeller domain-containing protein [Blastocatellia bacterium]
MYWISSGAKLYGYDSVADEWMVVREKEGSLLLRGVEKICFIRGGGSWFLSSFDGSLGYCRDDSCRQLDDVISLRPGGIPRDMFSTRSGALWVVLPEGLAEYDGVEWSSSLASPYGYKRLYRATAGEPPATADPESIQRLRGVLDLAKRASPNGMTRAKPVNDIVGFSAGVEGEDGHLWLGTERGLFRFAPPSEWQFYGRSENLREIEVVYEDRHGRLWVADDFGHVAVFDVARATWTDINLVHQVPVVPFDLDDPSFSINGIYEDMTGQIFFATQDGLAVFVQRTGEWKLFTPENSDLPDLDVTGILEDSAGRIWISTGEGIVVLDREVGG